MLNELRSFYEIRTWLIFIITSVVIKVNLKRSQPSFISVLALECGVKKNVAEFLLFRDVLLCWCGSGLASKDHPSIMTGVELSSLAMAKSATYVAIASCTHFHSSQEPNC